MSKKVFDQIAEGLKEALAVTRGEAKPHGEYLAKDNRNLK